MAEWYGAETTVPDWSKRLRCSECGVIGVSRLLTAGHRSARNRHCGCLTFFQLNQQLKGNWRPLP
jgi:hypothetical protein